MPSARARGAGRPCAPAGWTDNTLYAPRRRGPLTLGCSVGALCYIGVCRRIRGRLCCAGACALHAWLAWLHAREECHALQACVFAVSSALFLARQAQAITELHCRRSLHGDAQSSTRACSCQPVNMGSTLLGSSLMPFIYRRCDATIAWHHVPLDASSSVRTQHGYMVQLVATSFAQSGIQPQFNKLSCANETCVFKWWNAAIGIHAHMQQLSSTTPATATNVGSLCCQQAMQENAA